MIDASESSSRFHVGRVLTGDGGQWSVEWIGRQNCSMTPRQLTVAYFVVCGFSLAVAGFFWVEGVRMVMPFAGIELVGIAAALVIHARHVGDVERIALVDGQLTIDRQIAGEREHMAFASARVRIDRAQGGQALVRLSGQGRHIAVGRHVRPHLRPQLADELQWAIRAAR